MFTNALPPVVDADTWQCQLDALRAREKAATRELRRDRRAAPPDADGHAARLRCPVRRRHQGPIVEALAYRRRVGNAMTWYSTANSPFGSDVGAPPEGGFAVNVFLRDRDTVYRTWRPSGRGTEQFSHSFALIDLLPYGRQEEWQDSPESWPQGPTFSR